jgi:hypothetical protein
VSKREQTLSFGPLSSPDLLKAAEEKMNDSLLAYTERGRQDSLRHTLIEDLKRATTEFLELRRPYLEAGGTKLD